MPSAELTFVTPGSLDEALGALATPGAMLVGGGTSMALLLKNGLIEPSCLVYIGKLAGLSSIEARPDGLHLGATATLRELSRNAVVREQLPALAKAAGMVGNPRVRAVATVGGAIAHGDPRQDLPPVLLVLDATVLSAGATATRTISMAEFLVGFMETALEEDEIITEVVIPPAEGRVLGYSRFTPGSDDDYPTVGVAVALQRDADGVVSAARIALGGVAPSAVSADAAAALLVGTRPDPSVITAAAEAAMGAADPSDDQRGSASYKRDMVGVWTRRTIEACLA